MKILIIYIYLILAWFGLFGFVYAEIPDQHMLMRYNIISIDPQISDKQCQDLLSTPFYYSIRQGNIQFLDVTPDYKIDKYEPMNLSQLEHGDLLFTGILNVHFELNGQLYSKQENLSFVLNREYQVLKGGFILSGLCKGNLIGWLIKNNNESLVH
jgi:hypothetical protein